MATYTCGYLVDGSPGDYTTLAAAKAAVAVKDTLNIWYSNATQRRRWSTAYGTSAVPVNINGMVANRGIEFHYLADGDWLRLSGDCSAADALITVSNLAVYVQTNSASYNVITWNDTSGSATGLRVTQCALSGGYMCVRGSGGGSGTLQVDRCLLRLAAHSAVYSAVVGTKVYNNTAIACVRGFNTAVAAGAAMVVTNCYAACQSTDFVKTGAVAPTVTYCSSSDATADDWGGAGNRINDYTYAAKFWGDNDNGFPIEDFRILTTSPLYHAGTNLSLGTDCDGNAVDGSTPSIGWHEGTSIAFPGSGPTFAGITGLTDNADGTLTATWAAATGHAFYRIHLHTSSLGSGEMTYIVGEAASGSTSCRLSHVAAGTKLVAGTTYYCLVEAISSGSVVDGNAVNLSVAVTNPFAVTTPTPVVPAKASALLGATATTVYTCPASKRALAVINVVNVDSSDRTITLYKVASGGSAGDSNTLVKTYNLVAAGAPYVSTVLALEPGDFIQGLCSAANKATAVAACLEETLQ